MLSRIVHEQSLGICAGGLAVGCGLLPHAARGAIASACRGRLDARAGGAAASWGMWDWLRQEEKVSLKGGGLCPDPSVLPLLALTASDKGSERSGMGWGSRRHDVGMGWGRGADDEGHSSGLLICGHDRSTV